MPTHAPVTAGQRFTIRLGEARPDEPGLGGKGASLNRLGLLGRPIPPGFCLTAAAYELWLATATATADVAGAIVRLPDEAARAEIEAALTATPTPPPVERSLDDALADVATRLERPLLAVRSSALDEDGTTASFAGVHETELGRRAPEVPGAVRRCWLSLWSRPAIAYRARRGLAFDGAAMAVVVQALVPADVSAVVFTRHPVTGRDDVLINAIRGLGEPMVSGLATPETIVVDRSRRVIERVPGDRGDRLWVDDGDVVTRRDVDPAAVLGDAAAIELAEISLDIEARFGAPVDIEAARADGRWVLLQARPITTSAR